MKALQLTDQNDDHIIIREIEKPFPEKDQVLVKIKAASLNHRDQWCREGKYPGLKINTTLGSDGSGVVENVGVEVDKQWLNKAVIINPNISWGDDPAAQAKDYHILGMPTDGTFAEYVVVNADRLVEKPQNLSFEEAASLPIGGMTAYRALFTKALVKAGQKVLVTGIGGGVSQFASLFLKASNIDYYVTSGSDDKIVDAVEKGAITGFNYKKDNWWKDARKVSGGFDVVIDSGGGSLIDLYIGFINPGGRIICYGSTTGMPKSFDIFKLFWSQASIHGSTMANDKEFSDMIDFISQKGIRPSIDSVRPFSEIITAFNKMKAGEQTGKLVITF